MSTEDVSDILVVCGQGTYRDGAYYTEYADRDVYLGHAMNIGRVASEYRYDYLVCSGSYTQAATPGLSEASSFRSIWADTGTHPRLENDHIFFDEYALDSAENLYLALMVARQTLGPRIPMRRIGVYAAWKFKKSRFTQLARELGIVERFYFHAFADAGAAEHPDLATKGEAAQMQKMDETRDYLLLSEEWARKRRQRYRNPDFEGRLRGLRAGFPRFFAVLDEIAAQGMNEGRRDRLREAFGQVIAGR